MSRRKKVFFVVAALVIAQAGFMLAAEALLRAYHGTFFSLQDVRDRPDRRGHARWVEYDEVLGYVPRTGVYRRPEGFTTSVDEDRFRRKPGVRRPNGTPILVVGCSFAFGAEVDDGFDFPAVLEHTLNRPVLNAGVGGYGIDQIVLRAERLLPIHEPDTLIVSLISPDMERAEYSYYYIWKPFFTIEEGELVLQNVPVPRSAMKLGFWKSVAIHSHVAHEIFRRASPDWWYLDGRKRHLPGAKIRRARTNGVMVARKLLERIKRTTDGLGVRLVLVALRGNNSDIEHLPPVLAHARHLGIEVVDLTPGIEKLADNFPKEAIFRPKGHLSPSVNRWVAKQIARVVAREPEHRWPPPAESRGSDVPQ